MEKSIIRLVVILLFIPIKSFTQQDMYVFNTKGLVFVEINNTDSKLSKGDLIYKNNKIILLKDAKLTAINKRGKTYSLNQEGEYNYKDLIKRKESNYSRLTTRFFKYIWKELFNTNKRESVIAAVYRGDELMEEPKDSTIVEGYRINFEWRSHGENANYYFILRNKQTKGIFKISTNATKMSMDKNNPIFDKGCEFEWAVVLNYPDDYDKIYFFSFMEASKLEELKKKHNGFVTDLKELGLDDFSINQILCKQNEIKK